MRRFQGDDVHTRKRHRLAPAAGSGKENESGGGGADAPSDCGARPSAKAKPKSHRLSTQADIAEEMRLINEVPGVKKTFRVLDVIGTGTFSTVYKARVRGMERGSEKLVALKRIVPGCRGKFIDREIACLFKLRGEHHVAKLHHVYRHGDASLLVLDYFDHEDFVDYYRELSLSQLRAYMKALLEALAHVHRNGIIHRDVKPANFLHNRRTRRFLLVDFGLAQEVTEDGIADRPPDKPRRVRADRRASVTTLHRAARYGWGGDKDGEAGRLDKRPEQHTVRAGTRGYRAPEVLLRCSTQTPAIDVWSAGVVMLSILSGTAPFFVSNRDVDGLAEIAAAFGQRRLAALAKFYGKVHSFGDKMHWNARMGTAAEIKELCVGHCPGHPAHGPGQGKLAEQVYSLLAQLLAVEPHHRITAATALRHPFLSGGSVATSLRYPDPA